MPVGALPGVAVAYPEHYVVINGTMPLMTTMLYSHAGQAALNAIVPGGQVVITGASSSSGASDQVRIAADATRVDISAGSTGAGRQVMIVGEAGGYGYKAAIGDFTLAPATIASVGRKPSGAVTFTSSISQDTYEIELLHQGAATQKFLPPDPL